MKSLVVLLLLSSSIFRPISTQHTWNFINPEVVADLAPYNNALANADLDRFRYFDVRNTIHFENGLNVELLSANEVTAMGLPVKTTHVRTQPPTAYSQSIFKLLPNGLLVELPAMQKRK